MQTFECEVHLLVADVPSMKTYIHNLGGIDSERIPGFYRYSFGLRPVIALTNTPIYSIPSL